MKKLLFILSIAVLFGCDKKDDPKPLSIVGKWEVTSEDVSIKVGDKSLKEYLISTGLSEADADIAVKQQVNSFILTDVGRVYEFTSDGHWGTRSKAADPFVATGSWSISDDQKTLNTTDLLGTGINPILELTADVLQISRAIGGADRLEGYRVDWFLIYSFKRL